MPLPDLISVHGGPAPTTPADREAAISHMRADALKGLGIFGTIALTSGLAIRPFKPHTADALAKYVTGTHLPHPPAPRPALPRPGLFTLFYALPAPFGVVPPETYGIRPDYLARSDSSKDSEYGDLLRAVGGLPGEERMRYYQQREADKFEQLTREMVPKLSTGQLTDSYRLYSDPQYQLDQPGMRASVLRNIVRDELISRGVTFQPAGQDLLLPRVTGDAPTAIPSPTSSYPGTAGGGLLDGQPPVGPRVPEPQPLIGVSNVAAVAADPTNPLPPIPTGTSQRPADPSSTFAQEAADNAPRFLKDNVFGRRDP